METFQTKKNKTNSSISEKSKFWGGLQLLVISWNYMNGNTPGSMVIHFKIIPSPKTAQK